jgi:hypothetical protein
VIMKDTERSKALAEAKKQASQGNPEMLLS